MKAFVLTLRYTGFRMSDVMKLHKGKIDGQGRVFIRTTKTNEAVRLPLPQELRDALKAIEREDSPYYFTKGKAKPKSALTIWGESFSKLLELAKVVGHPHQYRHTLATDLLSQGVSVEDVAAILGNSPAIVLKHYAPWVKARQDALDTAIKKLWTTK
jgi:integrase/recombinase XerD